MKIYLAGPLFTLAERDFNAALAARLVDEPYHHIVELPQNYSQDSKNEDATFRNDVDLIEWSDVVVANMDGADPDSGTCWECGYAYARRIGVVIFRTDWRATGKAGADSYNLMMTQSADERLPSDRNRDLTTLAAMLHEAAERAREKRPRSARPELGSQNR
jgi:nucleoside 2-deoxyribosyltransferase